VLVVANNPRNYPPIAYTPKDKVGTVDYSIYGRVEFVVVFVAGADAKPHHHDDGPATLFDGRPTGPSRRVAPLLFWRLAMA
jgi:hypothetical protein